MKTRNLMLLALACGVAIMLSGAVLLYQLTTQEIAEPPVPLGTMIEVGDMDVTVLGSNESAGVVDVELELGGTADPDPTDGFRLIASGRVAPTTATTCGASTTEIVPCAISFDVSGADGVSRVLVYERGDQSVRWQLS